MEDDEATQYITANGFVANPNQYPSLKEAYNFFITNYKDSVMHFICTNNRFSEMKSSMHNYGRGFIAVNGYYQLVFYKGTNNSDIWCGNFIFSDNYLIWYKYSGTTVS